VEVTIDRSGIVLNTRKSKPFDFCSPSTKGSLLIESGTQGKVIAQTR
jgi:hypothetical protein